MEYNIHSFLTEQTRLFYEQVILIIKKLEDISHTQVVVFGGLVRRIIECYFDSSANFKTPDVDIWFLNGPCNKECDYQHEWGHYNWGHSFTTWGHKTEDIFKKLSLNHELASKDSLRYPMGTHRINYGVVNMTIDNIKFDMCTSINKFTTFDTLSDFVCNNLFFDSTGKLYIRVKCDYSIEEIIDQIKNKKLIDMLDRDFVRKEFVEYWDPEHKQFYEDKWKYREDKMLNYGYTY
jgi:hypothetical protein